MVGREAFEALDRSQLEGAWPHDIEAEHAWLDLDLRPGDSLRITVARDRSSEKGDRGLANAIPVASPGVRWNCGGWIDARVAQVDLGSRRATLLVEMGEIDSGHAGPNAFHTTKDVVLRSPAVSPSPCMARVHQGRTRAQVAARPAHVRGAAGADAASVPRW